MRRDDVNLLCLLCFRCRRHARMARPCSPRLVRVIFPNKAARQMLVCVEWHREMTDEMDPRCRAKLEIGLFGSLVELMTHFQERGRSSQPRSSSTYLARISIKGNFQCLVNYFISYISPKIFCGELRPCKFIFTTTRSWSGSRGTMTDEYVDHLGETSIVKAINPRVTLEPILSDFLIELLFCRN